MILNAPIEKVPDRLDHVFKARPSGFEAISSVIRISCADAVPVQMGHASGISESRP